MLFCGQRNKTQALSIPDSPGYLNFHTSIQSNCGHRPGCNPRNVILTIQSPSPYVGYCLGRAAQATRAEAKAFPRKSKQNSR